MTRLMQCDGCGEILGDTTDNETVTERWYELNEGVANGLLAPINLDLHEDFDEPRELYVPDDPRHFCSVECVASWSARRIEENQ